MLLGQTSSTNFMKTTNSKKTIDQSKLVGGSIMLVLLVPAFLIVIFFSWVISVYSENPLPFLVILSIFILSFVLIVKKMKS